MVKHSLNRLYEKRLFGSGWPTSPPRDYPHVMVEDNFTFLYDSSHVDPTPKMDEWDLDLEYLIT